VRWIRNVLGSYAWVDTRSVVIEVPVTNGSRVRARTVLRLHDATGTVVVERLGVGQFAPSVAPTAWVAGLGRSRFVVAPVGGAPVLAVRPVRRVRVG
jgi:hypothetical protein